MRHHKLVYTRNAKTECTSFNMLIVSYEYELETHCYEAMVQSVFEPVIFTILRGLKKIETTN